MVDDVGERFDVIVVGGGIVGLAVARQVLIERPGSRCVVLEKEHQLAVHQTGRNSGVIHAGVYYAPGSLKSRLCRRGVSLLREFCSLQGVQVAQCGKVVMARGSDELPELERLRDRAVAAGVPGATIVDRAAVLEIEPHVGGVAGLVSPTTAIVDFRSVADALACDLMSRGGLVVTGQQVLGIRRTASAVAVSCTSEVWTGSRVVVCAGLHSDRVSRLAGDLRGPQILPFRGEYFRLRPEREWLVNGLIYPVPDPRYPFLGVHFTRRIGGGVDVGPNAVLALAREGYRWRDFNVRDAAEILGWSGTRRLASSHWRTGLREVVGSASRRTYARAAKAYVPALTSKDLVRSGSGVRAQAVNADGSLVDDFVLVDTDSVLSVRNAPSPAATASLAIAEHIVARMWPTGAT